MIANHSTLKNALTTATIKTSSVSMMVQAGLAARKVTRLHRAARRRWLYSCSGSSARGYFWRIIHRQASANPHAVFCLSDANCH